MKPSIVEEELRKLTAGGRPVRPSKLIARLSDVTGVARREVQSILSSLHEQGKIEGVSRSGEPIGMVRWVGTEIIEADPSERALREAISGISDSRLSDEEELCKCKEIFKDLPTDDIARLLLGLLAVIDDTDETDPVFLSGKHLLGSAKALKNLRRVGRLLGLDLSDTAGELFVVTAGPSAPEAVVLIENIRSFSAFARSAHVEKVLAIAAFGYGLTMENLGPRLAQGQVVACPAYGERVDLRRLMASLPVYFWGDLDKEGLRIFESLRSHVPGIQLSAAYAVLERNAGDVSRSHPYHPLFEKAGQREPQGVTPEVRHLAEVCADRAVDQESVGRLLDNVEVASPYKLPAHQHDN